MIQQFIIFSCISAIALGLPNPPIVPKHCFCVGFNFITRDQWNAREPVRSIKFETPVENVVIHHTYHPGACYNTEDCSRSMRAMQNFHQLNNGWDDIGYNFAIGSDGQAYEGRGWDSVGAHAAGFNSNSIGIALIGDWRSELPPQQQLETAKLLIAAGVNLGYISPNYILVGHRQVRNTICPGDALFKEISTWDRFSPVV